MGADSASPPYTEFYKLYDVVIVAEKKSSKIQYSINSTVKNMTYENKIKDRLKKV